MATKARSATDYFEEWYKVKDWQMPKFQVEVFEAISLGHSGLLNAPTGSGKTYAAFIPLLSHWLAEGKTLNTATGLQVLWISPVRALAKDLERALQDACDIMQSGWQVAVRTGDTSAKERQLQKRNVPQCLITTPESLHLLMATQGYTDFFKTVRAVVVDEWHELLGTKRAVQLELSLSRLRALCPTLLTWGISATIGNLEQALQVLLGATYNKNNHQLIKANLDKEIQVETLLPDEVEQFPWGGHLGITMLEKVLPIIESSATTLIFTNTRSQCEIWYQRLLEADPMLAGVLAIHHSSLSQETRQWVEQALHHGQLKATVCTSSLDLGVDFKTVETIVQIGGPKGVARFLQRAGRSGHAPGQLSRIYMVPTHSLEIVEASCLKDAIKHGQVEAKIPVRRAFDVLGQYLLTLSIAEGFNPAQILSEVRNTYCYSDITDDEWGQVLLLILQGGESLAAYSEYAKVKIEDDLYKIKNRRMAMQHRVQIGTIASDTMITVKYLSGKYLGSVEEYFVSSLKVGAVFTFAGTILEVLSFKDNAVYVKKGNPKKNLTVPSWQGGRMPLSSKMSALFRAKLDEYLIQGATSPEMEKVSPLLQRQSQVSVLPSNNEFLIEMYRSNEGTHLFFYTFEGRFVNEGLASLIAYRISKSRPINFSIAMTDYGFELLTDQHVEPEEVLEEDVLTETDLEADLLESMNAAMMAARKFRDIACIAGLTFRGMPGVEVKTRHLQASSNMFFKVFSEYEPDNLLLRQAYAEVMADQFEESRLRELLGRLRSQTIVIKRLAQPSPFSFPIMVERIRGKLTTEKIEDAIGRLLREAERN